MAYPIPNNIFVTSPTTQRTEEIRLLDSIASGGFDGYTSEEGEQFLEAKNIADPRYGNNPTGAIEYLKSKGWLVHGKFHDKI
jgi:hypothetical protein